MVCMGRQSTKKETDLSYTHPGPTVFRKISFAVIPGQFGIRLIVDLQLLPFPAHAVWATAVKPSPPGLQTQAHLVYRLPGPLRYPRETKNGKVVRSENRGRKDLSENKGR